MPTFQHSRLRSRVDRPGVARLAGHEVPHTLLLESPILPGTTPRFSEVPCNKVDNASFLSLAFGEGRKFLGHDQHIHVNPQSKTKFVNKHEGASILPANLSQ
jgi:hypothetical protein